MIQIWDMNIAQMINGVRIILTVYFDPPLNYTPKSKILIERDGHPFLYEAFPIVNVHVAKKMEDHLL